MLHALQGRLRLRVRDVDATKRAAEVERRAEDDETLLGSGRRRILHFDERRSGLVLSRPRQRGDFAPRSQQSEEDVQAPNAAKEDGKKTSEDDKASKHDDEDEDESAKGAFSRHHGRLADDALGLRPEVVRGQKPEELGLPLIQRPRRRRQSQEEDVVGRREKRPTLRHPNRRLLRMAAATRNRRFDTLHDLRQTGDRKADRDDGRMQRG